MYIKPNVSKGTASNYDVPTSGDASSSQLVKGDDTRLSDSRTPVSHTHTVSQISDFPQSMPASDVYDWAKASTKPSYTASEVGAIDSSLKGANSGVAELDANGKVPSAQLPSYVDDVLEYSSSSSFPATGETGKIYIDTTTNKTYRWGGSNYVEISESLALGETSSTAFAGNRGKAIEDVIPSTASSSNKLATASDIPPSITVDSAMSDTSTNPVQNKVITEALDDKADVERILGNTWITKTWNGLTSFNGQLIWSDGENIYYSYSSIQYVLDKTTSTWSSKTWNGLTSFFGSEIWSDGDNIYYSDSTTQYVLDKTTSTWNTKTWSGLTEFSGEYIWSDGENIYYSSYTDQYVLNKATSTWSSKTWSGFTKLYGDRIWTDGDNIYYSYTSTQKILDKATSTWNNKTWSGLTNFYGQRVWSDGDNIYYSSSSDQYVLNKSTSKWSYKTWNGYTSIGGYYIWTDGDNIYYSKDSNHYVLNKFNKTVIEDSITIKSNGDVKTGGAIIDGNNKNLSNIGKKKIYSVNEGKTASGTITLTDNYDDFDFIIITTMANAEQFNDVIPMPLVLANTNLFHTTAATSSSSGEPIGYKAGLYIRFDTTNKKQMTLSYAAPNQNWVIGIREIWGVRL